MIAGMSWLELGALWGVGALVTSVGAIVKVGLRSSPIYWLRASFGAAVHCGFSAGPQKKMPFLCTRRNAPCQSVQ